MKQRLFTFRLFVFSLFYRVVTLMFSNISIVCKKNLNNIVNNNEMENKDNVKKTPGSGDL